jgi:hypothetical protein
MNTAGGDVRMYLQNHFGAFQRARIMRVSGHTRCFDKCGLCVGERINRIWHIPEIGTNSTSSVGCRFLVVFKAAFRPEDPDATQRRRLFMSKLFVLSLFIFASVAFPADQMGTWKLNTAKSKYTGMPMPKELTVTYTPEGSGWRYEAKGTSANGQPIDAHFTYVKDGEEIKTTGFPNWDSMVLQNAKSDKATVTLKREAKVVGSVTRILSADGKMMTIRGKATTPEGKQAMYVSVYDKQ